MLYFYAKKDVGISSFLFAYPNIYYRAITLPLIVQKDIRTPKAPMPLFYIEQHLQYCVFTGGDEENRTPVRKYCFIGFSECILCFGFKTADAHKLASLVRSR